MLRLNKCPCRASRTYQMMASFFTAFLLSVALFWRVDASIPGVGKFAVDASDEITNFALHFDSSEKGLNEVFANLYNDLFYEDGSSKKKAVNDPDGFHCYKGNGKLPLMFDCCSKSVSSSTCTSLNMLFPGFSSGVKLRYSRLPLPPSSLLSSHYSTCFLDSPVLAFKRIT